jgi:Inhibitor of Apoptosis domain
MATAIINILYKSDENPSLIDREQIIKEVAVVDLFSFASQQWRFCDPPSEDSVSIDICGSLRDSLDGDVPYSHIYQLLKKATESYKILFVCGKRDFENLKSLLRRSTVFDLHDLHGLELTKLPVVLGTECLHHTVVNARELCSHANAYRIAVWCSKNFGRINMMSSEGRLQTFANWDISGVDKYRLADIGFFRPQYEDHPNLAECIYCGLQLLNWTDGDIPIVMHRNFNRYCVLFNKGSFTGFDL